MADAERQWYIAGRWQEYEGEGRANLLRIIAVAVFYAVELVNNHGLNLGILELPRVEHVDRSFHLAVTALAGTWTFLALAVAYCLRRRIFPSGLKYLSSGVDIVLLTWILVLANGPRSPLVVGYFLIPCLAALRFSLRLVWFTTAGAAAGYLVLLAYASWFSSRNIRVERYQQITFVLALVLCGVIVGQVLRRVRRFAEDYARRLHPTGGPT
jgi:hypothetical protein